jgi:hypothetical protein
MGIKINPEKKIEMIREKYSHTNKNGYNTVCGE